MRRTLLTALTLLAASSLCLAQRGFRGGYRPPEILWDRRGVPDWELDPEFPEDVFSFVRVMYTGPGGRRGWGKWMTDYPDADLNLSFRLQQLTSLKVNPNPIVLELSDPRIFDYPFLYIVEPGGSRTWRSPGLDLSPEEAAALRRYCLNGGFVMVDDFWGETEWANFYDDYRRVFPDREPVELPIEHEIFNCVYELKEKPQVTHFANAMSNRASGITWETYDSQEPHYRGVFDDDGRMMMIICHNTDLADGWEREADDNWFFREFSEKKSYPMGINIIFYAMTH